jgi:hypothetical protein
MVPSLLPAQMSAHPDADLGNCHEFRSESTARRSAKARYFPGDELPGTVPASLTHA